MNTATLHRLSGKAYGVTLSKLPHSICVCCVHVCTYRWDSEATSLKMPSGSSEISLPWRDLRGKRGRKGGGRSGERAESIKNENISDHRNKQN